MCYSKKFWYSKEGSNDEIKFEDHENTFCKEYLFKKQHRLEFFSSESRAKEIIIDIIHWDLEDQNGNTIIAAKW